MARKTVDELVKEKLAALNQDTEAARAVKEATMKSDVETYNQQVDVSVAQQSGIYQDSIRAAERAEKTQLDDNHIDELVARKNLENTMADIGLTDSGLNRGQQTAITVMRGNADAGARQSKVDRVQILRDAIDQVMIGGEQQKTAYQQQQSSTLSEWYQNQLLANKQNANTAAVEQYNAETAAIEKQEEAIRKQQELMLKNGYVQDKNGSWVKDNTSERTTYAMTLIKSGIPENEAWVSAYNRYPSDNAEENAYYAELGAGYNPSRKYETLRILGKENTPVIGIETPAERLGWERKGESYNKAQEMTVRSAIGATGGGYSQDDWNEVVTSLTKRAKRNYEKEGLTGKELEYAVAKTVGTSLAQIWDVYAGAAADPQLAKNVKTTEEVGAAMYNALGRQFGGNYLYIAARDAGIEME